MECRSFHPDVVVDRRRPAGVRQLVGKEHQQTLVEYRVVPARASRSATEQAGPS